MAGTSTSQTSRKRICGNYTSPAISSNVYGSFRILVNTLENMAKMAKTWIYGHLHNGTDFTIDGCSMMCNPVGMLKEKRPYTSKYLSLCGYEELD